MIRKIQTNRDLAFVFIPKAFMELLGLQKGQKVDVRVVKEKIVITPALPTKAEAGAATTSQKPEVA